MGVTLTLSRLTTYDQDGTLINSVEQAGDALLTGALNAITERKKLYMEFLIDDAEVDMNGASIYVNFALFMPKNFAYTEASGPPAAGFSFVVSDTTMAAQEEMFFYANGGSYPNTSKNLKCYFKCIDATSYSIELEFYNTYDEGTYFNGQFKNNEYRFLSEYWNELNFNSITGSVYQTDKELRVMTYIKNGLDAADPTYYLKFEKTIYEGQSIHFNSAMTIADADGADLKFVNTVKDVTATITLSTTEEIFDTWYLKIIRIRNDASMNFIDNYDLYEEEIVALPTYNPDEDTYTFEHTLSADLFEQGANYRIILMGYGEDYEGARVLAGASSILSAISIVPYCDTDCDDEGGTIENLLSVAGNLSDIDNSYTGNELTCAIEERIRTQLVVDYSDDRWANNLECRGFCDFLGDCPPSNDIRGYLKNVILEIYTEANDPVLNGTVKNVLDYKVMTRTAPNTYSGGGITFDFDLTYETLTMEYDFRCRNEASALAIYTLLNGSQYFPIQDTQYWGGKTIYIKWRLVFYYHDHPTPFTDNLDYIQKLHVRDYTNDVTITNDDGEPVSVCVSDDSHCFQANIVLADPATYELINTIEPMPIAGQISESEAFTPALMDQETDSKFTSQEDDYTGGNANFCLDGTNLTSGTQYKVSTMAKKIK